MKEQLLFYTVILMTGMISCSGKMPRKIGRENNRLVPCPRKPNCVSSFETGKEQGIKPLEYTGERASAMERLSGVISNLPRTTLVTREGNYLHAEFRSRVFRFVDDVEFLADDNKKIIHVRSASRTGYSDLGVNRKRVEKIRKLFQDKSVK